MPTPVGGTSPFFVPSTELAAVMQDLRIAAPEAPSGPQLPSERLTRELERGMKDLATHMGAPFDRFDQAELRDFAVEVVARADAEVRGFGELGVASLLMDRKAWTQVAEYLMTTRGRTLAVPEVHAPLLCDLQTHAYRAQGITGVSALVREQRRDAFIARQLLNPRLNEAAMTLTAMANEDKSCCNLRRAGQVPGISEKVARLGIVGWDALIQKKPVVVLPLLGATPAENGRVAASTINRIARAAPSVQVINMSGGPAPADGNLIVDLTGLRSEGVPEVLIRIKETLGIKTVKVLAPPHVAIRLVRDDSTVNVRNARAPAAIDLMEVERWIPGQAISLQTVQFGKTASPLPRPAFEQLLDARGALSSNGMAVTAKRSEPSAEDKRD